MAAVHQTQTTSCHGKFIQRVSPQCSIIVDDVDEGRLRDLIPPAHEDDNGSQSPEYTINRIKEFQRAAERRKQAFARLLEEHDQVVRTLKKMEESDATPIPAPTTA